MDPIRPDGSNGGGIVVDLGDGGTAVFSHGDSAMSLFDPATGRILDVNDAWIALYGWAREEALALTVQDVSAEPHVTGDAVRAAASSGGARIDVRWHRKKDGTVFPVELTCGTVRKGERLLMFAHMHDVAHRLLASERVQRSESRFRAVIEHLPVGIAVHKNGVVRYMNPCLRAMLGFERSGEPGVRIMDIVHPEDREAMRRGIASVTRDRAPTAPLEARMRRRDRGLVWVEVTAIPFEFDGEPAALTVIRDVGERKTLEAQLILADRLSSLGRLAASVGHEINNPLTWILGNVQLLEREILRLSGVEEKDRGGLLDRLAIVEDGAKRVRDIVRDLRALSGSGQASPGSVDVCAVLDVCANMAEHELRHRARLVRDYQATLRVHANEARLGQVFLNLLVNAAQAIPEGHVADNEVRVSTRRLDGEAGEGGAGSIVVEVTDTGSGIPPEHRDRIFEPFFTTKESGGTGLGLSISHAIVTALGGTITVSPVAPHGTCFRVTLPGEAEPADATGSGPGSVRRARDLRPRRPRVLVVDDERAVAQTIRGMLDDCDVTILGSGRDAMAALGGEAAPFDAILLDLRMNDGSGAEVMRWLADHAVDARARVILMSGGSTEEILGGEGDLAGVPLLHKPFDLATLRQTLEAVLQGAELR